MKNTIYKSQVRDRTESPARRQEYHHLLKKLSVKEAMETNVIKLSHNTEVDKAIRLSSESNISLVVVDYENHLYDILDLQTRKKHSGSLQTLSDLSSETMVPSVDSKNSTYEAIKKLSNSKKLLLPVTSSKSFFGGNLP